MSTFSPSLRIELIASGSQSGTWGVTTNNNLGDLIEQAISGVTDLNVTAADITLTALNGVTDQSRSAVLSITGTAGTTRTITIPNVQKSYTVKNRSDATVSIKTSAGSAFSVPTLAEAYIYCDGDDVVTGRSISTNGNTLISATQPSSVAQSLGIAPTVSPALTGTPTAPTAIFGTNNTSIATTAFVQAALQAVYPIGSVYINATSASSPATLFGFGTWAEIGAGRVLVGQNVGDASFDVLGETGGSKDATLVAHAHTGSGTTASTSINHTHTFNANTGTASANHVHGVNDPGHAHTYVRRLGLGGGGGNDQPAGALQNVSTTGAFTNISLTASGADHFHGVSGTTGATDPSHNHTFSFTTASQGSSATNANLQPYLVVKMWQRTA